MPVRRFLPAFSLFLVAAIGCTDPGSVTQQTAGLAAGGASMAYVLQANSSASTVLEFSLTGGSSNAAAPAVTLTPPSGFGATAIAVDPSSGTLYVGGTTGGTTPEIIAYSAGASGSIAPVRTITVSGADFDEPVSMAVDNSGQLYVLSIIPSTSTPTVTVFPSTASGAATPVKTIAGSSTGIFEPTAIAVDSSANIYVADEDPAVTPYAGSIVIFNSTLQGNTPPTRAITNIANIFSGIAVDASGDIFATEQAYDGTTYSSPQIVEFAPNASAVATPTKVISGPATTLVTLGTVQLDSKGNLFVVNQSGTPTSPFDQLLGFGPGHTGNIAPDLALSSTSLTSEGLQFAIR